MTDNLENKIEVKSSIQSALEEVVNSLTTGLSVSKYCPYFEGFLELDSFLEGIAKIKSLGFSSLMDITAIHYPLNEKEFRMVYQFLNYKHNCRLMLFVDIAENQKVPSLCGVYDAAMWLEREVFDMFGIKFDQLKDHRRILTDYGFEGFPLRKDFPLVGHYEVRYDNVTETVQKGPVQLQQDYRDFDFQMPWSGTEYKNDTEK